MSIENLGLLIGGLMLSFVSGAWMEKTVKHQAPVSTTRQYELWCHIPEDTSRSSLCRTNDKQRDA